MSITAALAPFLAGFLAVLIFHQGVWAIFASAGKTPRPAWDMTPTGPLRIPAVINAGFWGGVWGIAIAALYQGLLGRLPFYGNAAYWFVFIVVGGLLTSLVALLIVFPLKGQKFAAGWNPAVWIFALLVNGAWGFGVGLLLPIINRVIG